MVKFLRNPCNIYISLLTFYSMQGTIIPTGGTILSQAILFIAMLMGMYYTIKAIQLHRKPVYFTGLNILFFTFLLYGLILLFSDHHYVIKVTGADVSNFSYLKSLFLSLPNIYAFYYFARKEYLTEQMLKKWTIVFFGVAVFRFFDYQMTSLLSLRLEGKNVEEVTNNMGYLFAALIPSIALFKEKIRLQYVLLLVCMFFILLGMKRGAIIVGGVSTIIYLYFFYKNKIISKGKILLITILIALACFVIVQFMLDNSEMFQMRILETQAGGSSGRDELYSIFWKHFINETDLFKLFLGNGANATLDVGDNYAHNDWLEIAINQGVIGLIIYIIYWILFFRTIHTAKYSPTAKLVLSITFVAFFIKTLFSMSYTGYSLTTCSVFGYYLAHYRDCES